MIGGNHPEAAPPARGVPLLTVALCTRNRAVFLRAAVESVLPQIADDTEILVIDNASTDNTPEVARALAAKHPRVAVIREEELGLSAARNTAMRRAQGRFVIFLDDDATAEPGWLAAYRELILRPPAPDLAAIGGAVFPRYGGRMPGWLPATANTFNWSDRAQQFPEHCLPWGGNLAVHRDRALAVGGFNPALGRKGRGLGAHEDSDLLERLKAAGGRLWWAPQARILHHLAPERFTFRGSCWGEFCQGRSNVIYRFRLNRGRRRSLAYRLGRVLVTPFHCLLSLVAAVLMLLTGRVARASQHVFRAARIAGFGLQLAIELFRKPEPAAVPGACR